MCSSDLPLLPVPLPPTPPRRLPPAACPPPAGDQVPRAQLAMVPVLRHPHLASHLLHLDAVSGQRGTHPGRRAGASNGPPGNTFALRSRPANPPLIPDGAQVRSTACLLYQTCPIPALPYLDVSIARISYTIAVYC